jgi:hydroxyethylthiazole kinase-like uncharacterized protein yjeF
VRALLDRAASRAFDRRMIDAGVPGAVLMENAGRGAADLLIDRLGDHLARPVIIGGPGQNGGDAWVIARRLKTRGYEPRVLLTCPRDEVRRDSAIMLRALEAIGVAIETDVDLRDATMIVDGLFGTGLDRPIEGALADLIARMNAHGAPIFAIDLPSGIDADTGAILGVSIEAAVTATFAGHKRGLWQMPGRACAGEIVCLDIGVPAPSPRDVWLELQDAGRLLPRRAIHAHKGTGGHVVVIAGSPGKTGAAALSGHAALRAGAGLVTVASRAKIDGLQELMSTEIGSAAELAANKHAAVLGPGLGLDAEGRALAIALAKDLPIPCVIDADALTAIASAPEILREASAPRVLTPHPGEAARLLSCSTEDIARDRYAAARRIAERTGQVVVLKGAGTVIADGTRLAVCPLGTSALGTAGTGDVLAGAIGAGLVSLSPFDAACAMVVLHARAGEIAARSDRGLLAHEVADQLPTALEQARRGGR